MFPRVKQVRHLGEYRLELSFTDGTKGELDFEARIVEPGSVQFQSYCAACHQYDGQRMGEAPPLAGSPWVAGPEERLIKIVLHGVHGPMEVDGKTYDQEMPGFGRILSDVEVASLLSFVRRRFAGR